VVLAFITNPDLVREILSHRECPTVRISMALKRRFSGGQRGAMGFPDRSTPQRLGSCLLGCLALGATFSLMCI